MRFPAYPRLRRAAVAQLLALATATAILPSAHAADLYYLGAQYTPGPGYPAPWPTEGSWFDTNLWQNNTLPSTTTNAIFGSDQTMPNDNTTHAPHILHFGNFGYFGTTAIPGGAAAVGTVTLLSDNWTFDFASGQNPDFTGTLISSAGSLTVSTLSLAPATDQAASLTLQSGTLTATTLNVATQAGQGQITLTSGTYLASSTATLGASGTGSFAQSGGTHSISGSLILGSISGATGIYTLDGGQLAVTTNEYLGYSGNGTFSQSNGTHTVSNRLYIGYNTGSAGVYRLAIGQLTVASEYLGKSGAGSFSQTGGTHTVTYFYHGFGTAGSSSYDLSNGRLATYLEYLGSSTSGYFTQSGGTHTVTSLVLGSGNQGVGVYVLTDGQVAVGEEYLGASGAGRFTQNGGNHSVTGSLRLGNFASATGTYTLSGGQLTTRSDVIGVSGLGTFTQSGGTHTAGTVNVGPGSLFSLTGGTLQITGGLANQGSLVVGGATTLNVGGMVDLGWATMQDLSRVDLTLAVNSLLILPTGTTTGQFANFINNGGMVSNAGAAITIPAGSVMSAGGGSCHEAIFCAGTITGQACLYGGLQLQGSTASVTLNNLRAESEAWGITGGQLNATSEHIGYSGVGSFAQSGGTHVVSTWLYLGYNAGAAGSYALNDGLLDVNASEYVGYSGASNFLQTGGTNDVANTLTLGYSLGAAGSYVLNGGVLWARNGEYLGYSGTGSFTQAGGTHTVYYSLCLGCNSTATGVYVLSGGLLSVTQALVGGSGTGSFVQTGGTQTIGTLAIGPNGLFSLTGGTLQVTMGLANQGSLVLGGKTTVSATGLIDLGQATMQALNQVTFTLASNSLLILPAGTTTTQFATFTNNGIVANVGTPVTIPSGRQVAAGAGSCHELLFCEGTLTGSATLYNGIQVQGASARATVDSLRTDNPTGGISGGQLTAKNDYIGYSHSGGFEQTGGTHTVSSSLCLGYNASASGTYALSGGQLLANSSEYIGYSGSGSFRQSGGTHTVSGALYLGYSAGAVGVFTLTSGQLITAQEYIGGYSGAGSFTQTGGTHTTGTLRIYPGDFYSLTGGTLQLTGGLVNSSGSLVLGGTATINAGGQLDLFKAIVLDASQVTINMTPNSVLVLPAGSFGSINNPSGLTFQNGRSTSIPAGTAVALGSYDLHAMIDCAGTLTGSTITGGIQVHGDSATVALGTLTMENPSGLTGGQISVTNESVGNVASASFLQSGGTHSIMSSLSIGSSTYYGSGTYTLSNGQLKVNGNESVGPWGRGTGTFTQTGGTHTVFSLNIGQAYSSGTYTLSGGQLSVTSAEYLNRGVSNTGTLVGYFAQTSGTHSAGTLSIDLECFFSLTGGTLQVSSGIANQGSLALGGTTTLSVGGMVDLGQATMSDLSGVSLTLAANSILVLPASVSTGDFASFINNGGMVTHAGASVSIPAGTIVAAGGGSCHEAILCAGTITGDAYLYGGIQVQGDAANVSLNTLRVDDPLSSITGGQLTTRIEYTGRVSSGIMMQSGGTHTVSFDWYCGANTGVTGSYFLSDGQLTTVAEYIGYTGIGRFTQSGGTHTASQGISLGLNTGAYGAYALSGGQLTVPTEKVGVSGTASFTQTGGNHAVGTLQIGPGSLFSLAGGTLQVTGGLASLGSFELSGTTFLSVGGMVDLGHATLQDIGRVSLTVGANSLLILPAGVIPSQFGSFTNNGALIASAGAPITIPAGNSVVAGGGGSRELLICAGTLSGSANLYGGVRLQDTSAKATLSALWVEDLNSSSLTAGQLSTGTVTIGSTVVGSFIQSGGTHAISGSLYLGYNEGGIGSYILNDGQLTSRNEYIGYSGNGQFTQVAGTHTLSGSLYVAYISNSSGTLMIQGGTTTASGGASIGRVSAGTLLMSGGFLTAATGSTGADLTISERSDAMGIMEVSNGTVTMGTLYVGRFDNAAGTVIQSGGVIQQAAAGGTDWRIGGGGSGAASATGLYIMTGGTLTSRSNFQIGAYGIGTFQQSGGTVTLSGDTSIGCFAGSAGRADLTGGLFSHNGSGDTHLTVGEQGTGTLTISGTAVVQLASTLYMNKDASGGVGSGTVTLDSGGTLVAPGVESMAASTNAHFLFNGGTLKANAGGTTYMQGLTSAKIQAGGAMIDTNGYTITIAQPLIEDSASRGGSLVKLGAGTLTLTGTGSHFDGLQVAAGNLALQSALKINSTTASRGTPVVALDIAPNGLTFGTSGSLDITNHDVLLRYSAGTGATALATALSWLQSSKIKSTSLTTNQALACVNNAALATPFTSFDGIPLADANQILIKYTWKGDANLDGQINFNDYLALDAGYLFGGTDWTHGDFTGDSQVTLADYVAIDAAFLAKNQVLASSMIDLHSQQFGKAYTEALAAAVPEPASLVLLSLGSLSLLGRRRKGIPVFKRALGTTGLAPPERSQRSSEL